MKYKKINILLVIIIIVEALVVNYNKSNRNEEEIAVMSYEKVYYEEESNNSLSEVISYLENNNFVLITLKEKDINSYLLDVNISSNINSIKEKLLVLKGLNIIGYKIKIKDEEIFGVISLEYKVS